MEVTSTGPRRETDACGLHGDARVLISWLFLFTATMCGCQGARGPAVEFIDGSVQLDGKPVDGATVTFIPAAGSGPVASGISGPDGRFVLTTAAAGAVAGKGAPAGDYEVIVVKMESTLVAELDPSDPGYASQADLPTTPTKPKSLVPSAYGKASTSGLKATVMKGRNELSFSLDSKFKP
jgi:hypothetical protein